MAGNKSNVTNGSRIIQTDQGVVEFGSKNVDNSFFGSIANQREMKQFASQMQSTVKNAVSEIDSLNKFADQVIKKVEQLSTKTQQNAVINSKLYKDMLRDQESLTNLQQRAQEISEDQSVDGKELTEVYKKLYVLMNSLNNEAGSLSIAMDAAADSVKKMEDGTEKTAKQTKNLKDNMVKAAQAVSDSKALDTGAIDKAIARWDALGNKSKTVSQALGDSLTTVGNSLSTIMNTFNIEKLAQGIGRSSKVQLQAQLQQAYGLSNAEFNSFKSGIYGGVNTWNYSSQQIQQAMSSLNEIGVSLKDVPKYFDTILKGQAALGMTAQTQTALMELSTKTGRAELTLGTTTFAKYLKSIDNLSRSQLNELVLMNSNYESQAADIGVSSDAFSQANMALSGALAKATGNTALAGLLQSVSSSMMTSTDLSAEMLGMSSGDYKNLLRSGRTLFDILPTGGGRLNQYYRDLMNNYDYVIQNQDEYTSGMDSSSVQLVNQLVTLQRSGQLNQKMIQDFKNMTGSELKEMIDTYEKSLSPAETFYNKVTNFIDKNLDWQIEQDILTTLQLIANVLVFAGGISSVSNALGNIGSIFSGTGGAAAAKGIAKAASGGLSVKAAGGLSLAGGALMGIVDAFQMQGSTGNGWFADAARGFGLGTGSAQKSDFDNALSVGGNALKWGAIGAGIGSFIPVVGTLAGGIIGAIGGATAGLIGTLKDDQRLQEEQLNETKKVVNNTYATASSLSSNANSRTTVSVIPFAGGDLAAGGDTFGYGTGQTYKHDGNRVGGYKISSWYGQRGEIKNKSGEVVAKAGFHSGIDIATGAGKSLGAPYAGTVVFNGWNGRGGNTIGIEDANGYVHTFMHLKQKPSLRIGEAVTAGQIVGISGASGGNYSPHLHYSVSRGKYSHANTVDPYDFLMNSSIFNTSGVATYNSSPASTSSSGSLDRTSELIAMRAVGGDGGNPVVNSINDLKQTIIDLSNRTSQNEKLMRAITGSYMQDPRTA